MLSSMSDDHRLLGLLGLPDLLAGNEKPPHQFAT